jgi:hypothetical protein
LTMAGYSVPSPTGLHSNEEGHFSTAKRRRPPDDGRRDY